MSERGGARPGAGRKKGSLSPEKKRDALERQAIKKELATSGKTPLQIFADVMAGGERAAKITPMQFEAAKAAAPYMHPRLTSVQMNATLKRSAADYTDDELRAIAGGGAEGSAD